MSDVFVAKAAEFADGDRRIVAHDGVEIGVFHMHKVEDVLGPDRTWHGQRFSATEAHFVCPWHGYEYDIATGECAADRRLKLKSFPVVRRGEDIYVVA